VKICSDTGYFSLNAVAAVTSMLLMILSAHITTFTTWHYRFNLKSLLPFVFHYISFCALYL